MSSDGRSGACAWIDLLDLDDSDDVLAAATVGSAALEMLKTRARTVTVAGEPGPPAELGATYDWVVVEGSGFRQLCDLAPWIGSRTRLALLADNPVSPLRVLDLMARRPTGETVGGMRRIRRQLRAVGLGSTIVFGLLRSSAAPTTAFRVDMTRIAETVLKASMIASGPGRRAAIGGLRVAARWGLAEAVVPAWLVVASRDRPVSTATTPTGRIAVRANEQGALVLGPGPDAVEKRYHDPDRLEATLETLAHLEDLDVDVGGRLLDRPAPDRLRVAWVSGDDLDAQRLPLPELYGWLEQAAELLGRLQSATLDERGEVLVHGDFWLGAIIVDGCRIAGVIDWADSHRGDPAVDLSSLVRILGERSDISISAQRASLARVGRAHERGGGPASGRVAVGQWPIGPGIDERAESRPTVGIGHLDVDVGLWLAQRGELPFRFRHDLVEDRRLSHEAVAGLADRLPRDLIEHNASGLPEIFNSDEVPVLNHSPLQLVREVESLRCWVGLHNVEIDPDYRRLVDGCLNPIAGQIGDFDGGVTGREGYIFVSPGGSTTPAHMDFEYNFLLQIRGSKEVTVGFVDDETESRVLESMHGGGYGRSPRLPDDASVFRLEPGDGVYIGPRLVHMVKTVGDDVSISLSLVFKTPMLERAGRVHAANHDLRRLGLSPRTLGEAPGIDAVKSGSVVAWRSAKRAVLAVRR